MNYGCVVFLAVIVGALSYYFFPKYGARYWFTYGYLRDWTNGRGPVHTLDQEITPEMLAVVQHEYAEKDRERRMSRPRRSSHRPSHADPIHAEQ